MGASLPGKGWIQKNSAYQVKDGFRKLSLPGKGWIQKNSVYQVKGEVRTTQSTR